MVTWLQSSAAFRPEYKKAAQVLPDACASLEVNTSTVTSEQDPTLACCFSVPESGVVGGGVLGSPSSCEWFSQLPGLPLGRPCRRPGPGRRCGPCGGRVGPSPKGPGKSSGEPGGGREGQSPKGPGTSSGEPGGGREGQLPKGPGKSSG